MDGKRRALDIIFRYGGIDGGHHKTWVIDQVVRALTNCPMVTLNVVDGNGNTYSYEGLGESQEYLDFVATYKQGEDGAETYEYDVGIAP